MSAELESSKAELAALKTKEGTKKKVLIHNVFLKTKNNNNHIDIMFSQIFKKQYFFPKIKLQKKIPII